MIPVLVARARYRWRRLPQDERLMLFVMAMAASAYVCVLAALVILVLDFLA